MSVPSTDARPAEDPERRRLDVELIRERRIMAGISKGTLAAALGVSPTLIDGLEGGSDQKFATLLFLHGLADLLGLHVADLFLRPVAPADVPAPGSDAVDDGDPAAVGRHLAYLGAIHVDDLAIALGWTIARVRLALHHLEERLAPLGQSLSWVGDAEVRLMPSHGQLAVTQTLAERDLARNGPSLPEVLILHAVIGRRALARVGLSERVAIGRLRNAGLIATTPPRQKRGKDHAGGDTLMLTDEARFNLYLDQPAGPGPERKFDDHDRS